MVLSAPRFVRETLAEHPIFGGNAVPIIALDGAATVEGRRAHVPHVLVYGVDDRFWRFHDRPTIQGPAPEDVLLSPALASALNAGPGDRITLTVAFAEAVPPWTLHGRHDDAARPLQLRVAPVGTGAVGVLSPLDTSRDVPAAFVSLSALQAEPLRQGRVNAILGREWDGTATAGGLAASIGTALTLGDYGLQVRHDTASRALMVDSRDGTMDDKTVEAVTGASLAIGSIPTPVLTTMVSTIRRGDREVPSSFVSSLELQVVAPDVHAEELALPPIVLNEWTAKRLGASAGSVVTLDYAVKQRDGRLETDTGQFEVAGIVPLRGIATARSLTPWLPGISGARSMRGWTPRVPFDAARVQPPDEEYWERYGQTPKAFVPPQVGRALWRTSLGSATAVLVTPADDTSLDESRRQLETRLLERLTPAQVGIHTRDLQADGAARVDAARHGARSIWWYALPVAATALFLCFVAASAGRVHLSSAHTGAAAASTGARLRDVTRLNRSTAVRGVGAALLSAGGLAAWPTPAWRSIVDARQATSTGDFALLIRTTHLMHGPLLGEAGIRRLGLSPAPDVILTPFRVHDSESPLSIVTAGPPGVSLGAVTDPFIDQDRFAFTASLDRTDEERANPWLLLRRELRDASDPAAGPLAPLAPVVASAGTLRALSLDLGDEIAVEALGRPVRLRAMASLEPGLLDGVLWMRDATFLEWLPAEAGYRWIGVAAPASNVPERLDAVATSLAALGARVDDAADLAFARRHDDVWQSWMRLGGSGLIALLALAAWMYAGRLPR